MLIPGGRGQGRKKWRKSRGDVLHILKGSLGTLSIADNNLKKLQPKEIDVEYTRVAIERKKSSICPAQQRADQQPRPW